MKLSEALDSIWQVTTTAWWHEAADAAREMEQEILELLMSREDHRSYIRRAESRLAALEKAKEPETPFHLHGDTVKWPCPFKHCPSVDEPKPSGWRAREFRTCVHEEFVSVAEIRPEAQRWWRCGQCWWSGPEEYKRDHQSSDDRRCPQRLGWSEVLQISEAK